MHAQAHPPDATHREPLPRGRRIAARRDFTATYETGARLHGRFVVVFARPGVAPGPRLGITATKKVGGAVVRNRARRRVREIFRRWAAAAPSARVDLVVNVTVRAVGAPFAALSDELRTLLTRATAGKPQ
jgi:ribonuclease P protein component